MATTPNLGLLKPETNQNFDVAHQNGNMDIIDAAVTDINGKINPSVPIPITTPFGTTVYNKTTDGRASVDIQVTGKHYVNPLGKMGDCESLTPFTASGCTLTLDTSKKVFGANALKITLTATTGTVSIPIGSAFNVAGYALFSAYLDKGNATNITLQKDATGGGVLRSVVSTAVTPTRSGFVTVPSDNHASNLIKIVVTGSIGQVAYVDGIMDNEISASEYALPIADVLGLYPYAEGLAVVTNPSATITHADGSKTQTVIEGRFFTGENPKLMNGKVIGQKLFREARLLGKDYDWGYTDDYTSFKSIYLNTTGMGVQNTNSSADYYKLLAVRYDGKILRTGNFIDLNSMPDIVYCDGNNILKISIADADSGWTETLNPNSDEVKAFMNGWKAILNNGARYLAWLSTADNSHVPTAKSATVSATTNVASVTVTTGGTQYVSGDSIALISALGVLKTTHLVTGTPTATNIPTTNTVNAVTGDTIVKYDPTNADLTNLNYCKANVAPNYDGYRLAYKLATAEPSAVGEMSAVDARLKGDNPIVEKGNNTIVVDNGLVFGELLNPYNDGSSYSVNLNTGAYIPSRFRNRAQGIVAIYKNGVTDPTWTIATNANAYGIYYAYCTVANFDTTATYTVDYKILATQAPNIGTVGLTFNTGLLEAVADLQEQVNNRQIQDPILDQIVDNASYLKYQRIFNETRATMNSGNPMSTTLVLFPQTRLAKPKVTVSLDGHVVYCRDSTGSALTLNKSDLVVQGTLLSDKSVVVFVLYNGADATIRSNLFTYGFIVNFSLEIDARGGRP